MIARLIRWIHIRILYVYATILMLMIVLVALLGWTTMPERHRIAYCEQWPGATACVLTLTP